MKLLIFGYGNPGRKDDGLGNCFVEAINGKSEFFDNIDFEFDSNYQLNIEDAERIRNMDMVIFADASTEDIDDFCFSRVDGTGKPAFTTHAANPEYIFRLCSEMFGAKPETLLLHIKGYEWDFEEGISEKAEENLNKAVEFFINIINNHKSLNEISGSLLSSKCLK